jgi:hypothetical protein
MRLKVNNYTEQTLNFLPKLRLLFKQGSPIFKPIRFTWIAKHINRRTKASRKNATVMPYLFQLSER